ncbi:hypothetical protein EZJ43_08165 [Pedobacter changchengzhani]|uniref:Uncharacterized protein n=1 Tax=Pedobacter changchengzhani TaxID=2529274 RepID=A0A4V3A074_9SPHI|nr:hypothetical protein [Pedobacter changchengzhani]TDG36483.1 hypothetical protein EZJ43_08165 [Pedobacter changchengzhani]
MDSSTAYNIEQRIRDAGSLPEIDYQNQLSRIEEKFQIWKNKEFLERSTIFEKVACLSRCHGDSLSEWVISEMGILLEKSELSFI